jgi:hypothetical protein
MLDFNPILQQRNIMNKLASPLSERAPLASEDFFIPDYPNVPASHQHDFHKERMSKASLRLIQHILHMVIGMPVYLQVIPNSHTEITLKKQVYSILM